MKIPVAKTKTTQIKEFEFTNEEFEQLLKTVLGLEGEVDIEPIEKIDNSYGEYNNTYTVGYRITETKVNNA